MVCVLAAMNVSAEKKYNTLPDGTVVSEGVMPSRLFGDRHYAVFYSSAKNVDDSSKHPMGLDLKLRSYFIACRFTPGVFGCGTKNGKQVAFVCSKNEDTYRSYVEKFIDESNQELSNIGQSLIKGAICSFSEGGGKPLLFVVAEAITTESQGSSFVLAQKVKEFIREDKVGVFEIEGYVVKLTLVPSGSSINASDLIPPVK